MAVNPQFAAIVKQVKEATYGKDVRRAIADGLEICYGYTSGEAADIAAQRANEAAEQIEANIAASNAATSAVQDALANLDHIVEVSEEQPTHTQNKIWIQPQDGSEYKVATFAAYEALWNRMNEVNAVYEQGHGGIVNVTPDATYVDPNDLLKKRYVITYSDGATGEFFVNNGERGQTGAVDTPSPAEDGVVIYYKRETPEQYTGQKPTTYSTTIPGDIQPGDYLWTITKITYVSGTQIYLYSLSRMGTNGLDGTGAVNSVRIGDNGQALNGDIALPVDTTPTEDSGNLMTSGAIYTALQDYAPLQSPVFTGAPTAPTPGDDAAATRIATVGYVDHELTIRGTGLKRVTLTIPSGSTGTQYIDPAITENTYCLFPNFGPNIGVDTLTWQTSAGQLDLTVSPAPSSAVSIVVIYYNPVAST